MLQRQIIFKQLQELQRKKQLQELGDARNEHYINQLSSLKQDLGGQFPVNGMPVHDSSQILMVDKMQMMQDIPNESVFIPSHNNSMSKVGLSQSQFDVSLYGASTPNTGKNLDIYSHLQGPPDHSTNLSTKNNNEPLGMPSQPSGFGNSLLNPRSNLYSDQISVPDESLLPNEVPVQGFNSGISYENYSHQGMTAQRSALPLESGERQDNEGWDELSSRKVLKHARSDPAASLDPLEQKFLYSIDDNIWGSSFNRSINIGLGAFESATEHTSYTDGFPTTQSGSWSALMQSAAAETSSGDGGMQEERSGLNFHNPEPLTDNLTSNYTDNAMQNSNWVNTNLQNSSSPSAKPEIVHHYSTINGTFPGFQQPSHQYLRQKEGFHSESSPVSNQHSPRNTNQYSYWQKHHVGGNQLFQDFDLKDSIWLHGCTPRDVQKPFDQVDQLNIHSYSIDSKKISSGKNDEPMQALLGGPSSDLYSQSMTSQASKTMLDLLNKDNTSINHAPGIQLSAKVSAHNESPLTETSVASCAKPCNNSPMDLRTPQSYLFFPSLSMGNSCSTYPSGHNVNNHFENQHSPSSPKPTDTATNDLVYSADYSLPKDANFMGLESPELKNEQVTQTAVSSVSSQHVGFPTGLDSQWAFSEPEYREQLLGTESFLQKGLTEIKNPISVSRYSHDQELYRDHHLEAKAVTSSPLMTQSHQPSNTLEQIDTETPSRTAVSVPKKRKVAFDMVTRQKEVNNGSFMLQNIRVAELEWAEASNRRPEEVKNEIEILEDMLPRFRAKRRLVFTTQLMQQVFQPAPAVILSSDAGSHCDGVTYFTARFSFEDARLVTSNSQMLSDGNGMSPEKLKTCRRPIASDLSEVVEDLINKVKKLEGELLRMDKSLSIVDIKVESQELEKFSIINRFAKFHMKAQPTVFDPTASNGTPTVYKTYPQRYVSAHPMPRTVPEGTGCHSL